MTPEENISENSEWHCKNWKFVKFWEFQMKIVSQGPHEGEWQGSLWSYSFTLVTGTLPL